MRKIIALFLLSLFAFCGFADTVKIYFSHKSIQTQKELKIDIQEVKREIPTTDIESRINALLSGVKEGEDCVNCIPVGTKLLSAKIKNNIAYLDFSEDFTLNFIGAVGIYTQIAQIVLTVTEIKEIKAVQILINGKKENFMGYGEEVWIGNPFTRKDFYSSIRSAT